VLRGWKCPRKTVGKEDKCKCGDKCNHSGHWTIVIFEMSMREGNDAQSLGNSYPWQSVIVIGFTPIISTVF
jgi:hypothetical protein